MTAEAVVKTFLHHQLANPEELKNLTDEELRQLAADLDRLKATGVDLGKLSAGLAAALAGKDIDTAATTGGNAAEHNMFVIITVVLELMDKGLQAYDAYRLAKAIGAGDTDEAAEISAEIALGAATDAIPANVIAIKIGIAFKKFGLVGLSAKIVGKFGDEAAGIARFAENKLLDHFERHGADFGAISPSEYERKASVFLRQSNPEVVLEKIRENGDIVR